MQASLQVLNDGTLNLRLDGDAARAVFASVLLAARLHEKLSPLVPVAEEGLAATDSRKGDQDATHLR